ncbi:hypothetical protein [Cypionkella sp.]|uniref:hypothetical protein n=1 Tax=Cypionkella sp. TaxID=2811411 RepID=UPI00261FB717|nr:hypothetical protein [Cypionkella sp.]MDB5664917.1 hypothetical protein [Cypionkella sp.]
MDYAWIVPLLALGTLLAVCIFALVSKARTEERKHDPSAPKSTLAKDGPQDGVDLLKPVEEQGERKPNVPPVLE